MKRTIGLVVLMCLAGGMATALLAQEDPKVKTEQPAVKEGEKPKTEVRREGEPRREGEVRREGEAAQVRLPEQAARLDKVVAFTEDQKKAIVELNKAREVAVREANAKFQTDLMALMTPEQKAKWDAAPKEGERREGERREGERREGPRPEGERKEGDRPVARPPVEGPVSAGSAAEGTAAQGMVVSKGEDWISVKAEGDKTGTRYTTEDKDLIAAIGKLSVPSQVKVTFKQEGEARKLVSVRAQPVATTGVFEGIVTGKGERDIEAKPLTGDGPAEKFGITFKDYGPNKESLAMLAELKVGDKVKITWIFNERKRFTKIEKLGE